MGLLGSRSAPRAGVGPAGGPGGPPPVSSLTPPPSFHTSASGPAGGGWPEPHSPHTAGEAPRPHPPSKRGASSGRTGVRVCTLALAAAYATVVFVVVAAHPALPHLWVGPRRIFCACVACAPCQTATGGRPTLFWRPRRAHARACSRSVPRQRVRGPGIGPFFRWTRPRWPRWPFLYGCRSWRVPHSDGARARVAQLF